MPLDNTQPQTVMVPVAQLQQMQADQAKVQELLAQRDLDATAATIRAQAAIGQVESLARTHRAEVEAERQRAATIAAKAELTAALAKQPLVPHGVDQLTAILGSDITATPDSKGGFTVLSRDYRDVESYVQARLADPHFAHFRSDRQQAPTPVTKPSAPPMELPAEPRSLSEAFIANFQMQQQAREAGRVSNDPRLDPSRAVGLRKNNANGPAIGGLLPGWGTPSH